MTRPGQGWYRVEVDGPPSIPTPAWLSPYFVPCSDCRASAYLKWVGLGSYVATDGSSYDATDRVVGGRWALTVTHEDGCPTLAHMDPLGGPE